jgi:hypothetical protein
MISRTNVFARAALCAAVSLSALIACRADAPLDTLTFGSPASEQAHGLVPDHSDTIAGGLAESARRLLPLETTDPQQSWSGGKLAFTLKVDPAKVNYVTVRLWGSDVTQDRLVLFCEGKQVGYHHIGDIDLLDFGSDIGEPGFNGRFFYTTTPLPLAMTKGHTELHFEIRSIGRIWGYGDTFARYQRPMDAPTRGIYRIYTHTGTGRFVPPVAEKQGTAPSDPPVRSSPGPEVLDTLKARINGDLQGLLKRTGPLSQMQIQFLARAYYVSWTPVYENPKAVERIVGGLDQTFAAYRANPKLAESDPATPNPDWFGLGLAGDAVRLLGMAPGAPLTSYLDQTIDDPKGGKIARRAAWSEMLEASRDWHLRHRRQYTNQSMIIDMNSYTANRGVAVLMPAHALPEERMLHYLYQSVGLEPWLGSDTDSGPAKPLGDRYYELTPKGLTKELGYVGSYGEVIDWATSIYNVTRHTPGKPGDPKIEAQIEKISHARAPFRYPALDADGFRAMRLEPIVGWRDSHYPSDVNYGERPTWDASPLFEASATLDPAMVGYAQQMFDDNQYFSSVANRMRDKGLRVTMGLLATPDEYAALKAQPASPARLPMSPGRPDFVWADEEDGVVALKHGSDILYASLYWRARYAVNFRARVHYLTPTVDRIAVVQEDAKYDPSGLTYTTPDWTDTDMPGGGHRYPAPVHQAYAGEVLPIAKIPEGEVFKPGQENVHAGRATFYALHYGPYLIGMNCTADRSFDLAIPAGAGPVTSLTPGNARTAAGATIKVGPNSTVVFYLGGAAAAR